MSSYFTEFFTLEISMDFFSRVRMSLFAGIKSSTGSNWQGLGTVYTLGTGSHNLVWGWRSNCELVCISLGWLCEQNKNSKFIIDKHDWNLGMPESFRPLYLLSHVNSGLKGGWSKLWANIFCLLRHLGTQKCPEGPQIRNIVIPVTFCTVFKINRKTYCNLPVVYRYWDDAHCTK